MYAVKVRNRFEVLEDEEKSATDKYDRFIKVNKEAAEKTIPQRRRAKKTCFSSYPRVAKARDEIKHAYAVYQHSTSEENRAEYKKAKECLEDVYNLVIEEDLNSKNKEIETAHANSKHGQSWRLINDITSRKASPQGQLKGEIQKDRVTNWYNHFKNLLGSPLCDEDEEIAPILEGLDIKVEPFSQEEYEKAKKSLVEGKSCGEDNIPPEVLKRCNVKDIVLDFCNDTLLKGKKPSQWSILNIVLIPKAGDLSFGGNYRGISLWH